MDTIPRQIVGANREGPHQPGVLAARNRLGSRATENREAKPVGAITAEQIVRRLVALVWIVRRITETRVGRGTRPRVKGIAPVDRVGDVRIVAEHDGTEQEGADLEQNVANQQIPAP